MERKEWDFDSGSIVLDFANTAEFHASDNRNEMINSYTDLVSWSEAGGIISHIEGKALLTRSQKESNLAAKVLVKALRFREMIYRIFSALASNEIPQQEDLIGFNKILAESLENIHITNDGEDFSWGWQNKGASLDSMLWPIARETAFLLTSKDVKCVGECADDRGCGYLFIDASRNHSRRWCSMEACGNRAKAKRHYQKISTK